jgi:xanthine dehydrogenase accessory factor
VKELLAIIAARRAEPDAVFALATVVGVTGSSYRRPGARMLIGSAGRIAGSVSGGCLEEDIVSRGQQVMASGIPEVAVYDTAREEDLIFGSGLGCQGRIEILIEPLPPGVPWPLAETALRVQKTREAASMVTLVNAAPPAPTDLRIERVAESAGPFPRRENLAGPNGPVDVFIERIKPPLGLVIFGAGPDVPPLVRMARELGHHITIVDRRPAITAGAFPEADVFICARPAQVGERLRLGADSGVVIMNHHYETDREALELALRHRVAYLGMLGPRKRTNRILDELAKRGAQFSVEELAPLHAPAGLDLGSESPEQIALAILAEMQASLTGRSAGKLRTRSAPINAP